MKWFVLHLKDIPSGQALDIARIPTNFTFRLENDSLLMYHSSCVQNINTMIFAEIFIFFKYAHASPVFLQRHSTRRKR